MSQVSEWMSRPVITASVDTLVREAEALMQKENVSDLILTRDGRPVGIVSPRDIRAAPADAQVGKFVAAPMVTVLPTTSLTNARTLMDEAEVGCLPVISEGEIVGIISRSDLRRAGVLENGACAACGSRHHVRPDPRGTGLFYCMDCLLSEPAGEGYLDVGGGD